MNTISARDFNQQVSKARKAASREPIFITERGEPKHVLLSIEAYEVLTGSQRNIADLLSLEADIDLDLPQRHEMTHAAELD